MDSNKKTLRQKLQNALNKKHKSSKTNIVFGKMANKLGNMKQSNNELQNLQKFLSSETPRASLFNKKQTIRNRIKQSSNKYKKKQNSNKKNATNKLQRIVDIINTKIKLNIQRRRNLLQKRKKRNNSNEKGRQLLDLRRYIQYKTRNNYISKLSKYLPQIENQEINVDFKAQKKILVPMKLFNKKIYNNFINFYDNVKKNDLGKPIKVLGEGSYGTVKLLNNGIVVKKQDRKEVINELYIYIQLLRNKIPYIVPIYIKCNKEETNCSIYMPQAEGDLYKFLGKLQSLKINDKTYIENVLLRIIQSVTQLVYIASKHSLYFTDIKPENLLYLVNDKNELKIFATDLGSFYDSKVGGNIIATYQNKTLNYSDELNINHIMIDKLMCFYIDIMYLMFTQYRITETCKNEVYLEFISEKLSKNSNLKIVLNLIRKKRNNGESLTLEKINNFIQKL